MKEKILKQEVINVTRKHIVLRGARGVSMDEIAKEMGISKRTLYIMFSDKRSLVGICINEIKNEWIIKLDSYFSQSSVNPLLDLKWILREYLHNIYNVDFGFLIDMKREYEFNEFYKDIQDFWQLAFERILQRCLDEGYILDKINISTFTERLLEMINKSRVEGVPYETQKSFCGIVLRGIRKEVDMVLNEAVVSL